MSVQECNNETAHPAPPAWLDEALREPTDVKGSLRNVRLMIGGNERVITLCPNLEAIEESYAVVTDGKEDGRIRPFSFTGIEDQNGLFIWFEELLVVYKMAGAIFFAEWARPVLT